MLLPFAGGGAEAYSKLVSAIKHADNETAVYFIRYLHSLEEYEKAPKEISMVLGKTDISIYSHCVGSAVALQIIKYLEKDDTPIKHYFIGASIPPAKPAKWNSWNVVPDFMLRSTLEKAGADFRSLSDKKLKETLKNFRLDTDFATISYGKTSDKLRVPVSVIISKDDMFTKNYTEARKLWNNYFETVDKIHFIDTQSHYFQSVCSEKVAKIILGR